jgi:hypothetical protein
MTKQIKTMIDHLLQIAERYVLVKFPKIAKALHAVDEWIMGIDVVSLRSAPEDKRKEYDDQKTIELKEKLRKI